MPELPEVETMVRGLRPALEGRRIESLKVLDPSLLQGCSARDLERHAKGATVARLSRQGKWVVFDLEPNNGLIVIQPRMTGGFFLESPPRLDHARLRFQLAEGSGVRTIWYCDARRLGKVAWHADQKEAEAAFQRSQGPDALEIGLDDLAARLARTGRGIKPTLMDQKVLAGIGNIYADEVLFRAGIHPERPASSFNRAEVGRIHRAIRSVLDEAIRVEGSSFDQGYRTADGLEGGFLAQNAVHRRKGLPCPKCGGAIIKTKIAGLLGRPTYFCPSCQPPPPLAEKP